MHRDHLLGRAFSFDEMELMRQAAFHEAGHAAAIYLRNRYHRLPRISFRIFLKGFKRPAPWSRRAGLSATQAGYAKLEGGLLVENHELSVNAPVSSHAALAYRQACEADMVNLLAGPLAEAKHVALRDGEYINQHLVDYAALRHYGGKSDLEKIEDYLSNFELPPLKRAETLRELHAASFQFIDHPSHWRAISSLANYMVDSEREVIACDEAIAVLEHAIGATVGAGQF